MEERCAETRSSTLTQAEKTADESVRFRLEDEESSLPVFRLKLLTLPLLLLNNVIVVVFLAALMLLKPLLALSLSLLLFCSSSVWTTVLMRFLTPGLPPDPSSSLSSCCGRSHPVAAPNRPPWCLNPPGMSSFSLGDIVSLI